MDETGSEIAPSSAAEPVPPKTAGWGWWVRLIVILGLLAALVKIVEPRQLWQTLKGASWLWVAAAVPFALAAALADALKLDLLMRPHGYRGGWGSILRTNLVVNFVSLFLPGTVGGGAVAWYRLSKRDKLYAESFVALTLNSVLKLAAACLLAAVGLAFDMAANAGTKTLLPLLILAGAVPMLLLILILHTSFINLAGRVSRRLCAVRWMPSKVSAAIARLLLAFESYRRMPASIYGALSFLLGRKLLENVCFFMAVRAVGSEAGFARVLWIMCIVEVCGMIPLSLGGFGVPQVSYCWLFVKVGSMDGAHALASNLVSSVIFLPVFLAGAGTLLAELRVRRRNPSEPS